MGAVQSRAPVLNLALILPGGAQQHGCGRSQRGASQGWDRVKPGKPEEQCPCSKGTRRGPRQGCCPTRQRTGEFCTVQRSFSNNVGERFVMPVGQVTPRGGCQGGARRQRKVGGPREVKRCSCYIYCVLQPGKQCAPGMMGHEDAYLGYLLLFGIMCVHVI